MDVMESLSVHDLFQGLSSNSLLDSGFHDDDNRDSLLDLLSQSFPDMLTQPYGHLSSLPLDATDLQLCIQEEDYQDLDDNLVGTDIASLAAKPDEHYSPIKKLCPDQLDLLMGPLLDEDEEEDFKTQEKVDYLPVQCLVPSKPYTVVKPIVNALNTSPTVCNKLQVQKNAPLVAYVKPVLKANTTPEPVVNWKPAANAVVKSTKSVTNTSKMEDESSDEVDIETVDDDELNGRSGAEVLSAKLADIGCQAARVRVLPPRMNPESKSNTFSSVPTEKAQPIGQSHLPSKAILPQAQSLPSVVKPSPKVKEKEQSPFLVVEKIKQSAVVPRSSILIPHQGPPTQSRGKAFKQEFPKVTKSSTDIVSSVLPSQFDARTLDHDYCNTTSLKNPTEVTSKAPTSVKDELKNVKPSIPCAADEIVVMSVPSTGSDLLHVNSDSLRTDTIVNEVPTSKPCEEELTTTVVTPENEVSLSYCKWHLSCSQSPYSENRYSELSESRKRSSCSPSSLSSHSICRSRSRSSSQGRKSRSHRRKQSRGRSRSRHSAKRTRYTYSRSSSQSSFSSRSRSRSRSRSLSRSRSRTRSQSRSRPQSWDYKRTYNRAPVTSYNWAQDKRRYDEKTREIEERRVVYVGRLPDGTTKNDLRHRFGCFGPIQEVSVHFRDSGHNYGFVTFSLKRDAYQAVEHGNDDPNQPKFDLSFGGRRQFCRQRYADLDSQYSNYPVRRPSPANDFDSLLQAAKLKQKNY